MKDESTLYTTDKKSELAIKYGKVVEAFYENKRFLEEFRFLSSIIPFTETGLKNKDDVLMRYIKREFGLDPDSKAIDIQAGIDFEKMKEKLEKMKKLPKPKKTLLQLSDKTKMPKNDLNKLLEEAEKDGLVKKGKYEFQPTEIGVEVACTYIHIKRHGLDLFKKST